jgi:hypothetical protein
VESATSATTASTTSAASVTMPSIELPPRARRVAPSPRSAERSSRSVPRLSAPRIANTVSASAAIVQPSNPTEAPATNS